MPRFFRRPADLRAWFAKHAASADELIVGYWKTGSGKPSITWPESVDEALCVGWIDGVRKRIDEESYQIRFTPRRSGSHWSAINLARVKVLSEEGRMMPAGLQAYARRDEAQTARASYEQIQNTPWDPECEAAFRAERKAWDWFQAQAPSWRNKIVWWISSAKQAATRARRLQRAIESAKRGERLE
jgi:uncharacterized protein YdeI (YjbR/CyaY-like superfamily)